MIHVIGRQKGIGVQKEQHPAVGCRRPSVLLAGTAPGSLDDAGSMGAGDRHGAIRAAPVGKR